MQVETEPVETDDEPLTGNRLDMFPVKTGSAEPIGWY